MRINGKDPEEKISHNGITNENVEDMLEAVEELRQSEHKQQTVRYPLVGVVVSTKDYILKNFEDSSSVVQATEWARIKIPHLQTLPVIILLREKIERMPKFFQEKTWATRQLYKQLGVGSVALWWNAIICHEQSHCYSVAPAHTSEPGPLSKLLLEAKHQICIVVLHANDVAAFENQLVAEKRSIFCIHPSTTPLKKFLLKTTEAPKKEKSSSASNAVKQPSLLEETHRG